MTIEKGLIENIVRESLADSPIFLVEVLASRSNVIQVFIDSPAGISLDDCELIHRSIESGLDRDSEDYELQVSSPGLGQPMKVYGQYLKAVGQKLEILTEEGSAVKGTLLEVRKGEGPEGHSLKLQLTGTRKKPAPEEPVELFTGRIRSAKVEIDFKKL